MTGIGENTLAQPVKPPLRERRACLAKLVKNRLTLTSISQAAAHASSPRARNAACDLRAEWRVAARPAARFLGLGEDACAAAWEMDTVEGAREDSAFLLTLLHRPSRLQLALLLEAKDSAVSANLKLTTFANASRRMR